MQLQLNPIISPLSAMKCYCLNHGNGNVKCVSKIKSILSVIFNAIYGAMCIQLTHLSYSGENMCTLSYHHHQIGSKTHLPLFRVRSWNNGMLCIFFIFSIFNCMTSCPSYCTLQIPQLCSIGHQYITHILLGVHSEVRTKWVHYC